jgi:hypothetical protein
MKQNAVIGIVLIVLGVLALTYHFTYSSRDTVVDIGPIKATAVREHSVPIPPILGGLAIAGGLAVLIMGRKD